MCVCVCVCFRTPLPSRPWSCPPNSSSCSWARLWASRRCRCTAARSTGRPAPSAAWPGTLTAPGTAPSAPDTFPPPRGRWGKHVHAHAGTHAGAADKYLPFISPRCLLSSRSSCARRHGFCVNDVTGGRTWELSAHLQPAAALLKGVSVHRRLSLTSTGLLTSADVMLLSASWNFYFCGRNSTCLDLNSPANEVQTVH